jgi:hypothetical protein
VVVDQRREAVPGTIPDVPDERPLVEERAVLGEEALAVGEPGREVLAAEADLIEQAVQLGGRPGIAPGVGEEGTQALGGRLIRTQRWKRHDAVRVGVGVERIRLLVRPAVAEEPRDRDLQRRGGANYFTIEYPLCRIVGVWLWQSIRESICSDLLPVLYIERNLK